MPSLKEIRNRVRTVKNTQKITRAMKLVAGAKLKRAQDAVTAARPYAIMMRQVIGSIASTMDEEAHPLFQRHDPPRKALLIPMTSDRGLCGPFNSSIIRTTERFLRNAAKGYDEVGLGVVGRKGREYFKRDEAVAKYIDTTELVTDQEIASARRLAKEITDAFLETEVDVVYLVYNEFKSALTQEVVVEQLLPLTEDLFTDAAADGAYEPNEYIFEPSEPELLDKMLPKYVESQVFRAILESYASETGARMTAMDNATKNAGDLIDTLTLQMNRARQAMITTELMEITSGAEALKG